MDARLPPLSTTTRALLARERALPSAHEAVRRRLLERARAAIEDRPSGVGLRAAGNLTRRRGSRVSRTLLLVAATLAIAGLAAAGANMYGVGRAATPSLQAVVSPALRQVRFSQRPAPQQPASSPAAAQGSAIEPRRSTGAPPEPARAPSASTYALELGLLEPARGGIARRDFAGALAAIARHQREYPRGQLTQEREALRVRALWGMGARPEAERAAVAFRKRYPNSGLLGWMKAAATSP